MSVLEAVELSIRFGGLQALSEITVQVDEFEIVGLIGPNGAGKTTCFNCVTGFYRPQSGRVGVEGEGFSPPRAPHPPAPRMGRTLQPGGVGKSTTGLDQPLTAPHSRIELC